MSVFDDLLDNEEVSNEINSEVEEQIHMCSSWQSELEDMCSYRQCETCGNGLLALQINQ